MHVITPSLLASQIVHEVAHIDRDSPHIVCTRGQSKGKKRCDETIDFLLSDEAQAYSFHLVFLHDSMTTPLAGSERNDIKYYILAILDDQINNPPKYGPDGATPIKKYYGVE